MDVPTRCVAPSVRAWCLRLFLLLLGSGVGLGAAQAQTGSRPLFDGLTVGPGLSIYMGDLDGNPDGNLVQYLASGRVGFMIAADRRYGNASVGLELHYDRLHVDRREFELSNRIISLDLVGGYHFDLIQSDLIGVSGGVGLTLLVPHYERLPEDDEGVRRRGTRPVVTVPVSLSIQNRVRVGIRFTVTDYLDGWRGLGRGHTDLISFVRIGYRFDFVN